MSKRGRKVVKKCSFEEKNNFFEQINYIPTDLEKEEEENEEENYSHTCEVFGCQKKFIDKESYEWHKILRHGEMFRSKYEKLTIRDILLNAKGIDKKVQKPVKMSDILNDIEIHKVQNFFCSFVRTQEDVIICSIDDCNRKFYYPWDLEVHLSLVHEQSFEIVKYFQCSTDHIHICKLQELHSKFY